MYIKHRILGIFMDQAIVVCRITSLDGVAEFFSEGGGANADVASKRRQHYADACVGIIQISSSVRTLGSIVSQNGSMQVLENASRNTLPVIMLNDTLTCHPKLHLHQWRIHLHMVRLPAGALSSQLGQLSLPSLRGR